MSIKILLAEDEPKVQKFIRAGLEQSGMQVDSTTTLEELDATLQNRSYDVLILDRILHGKDSLYLIPRLKKQLKKGKILVLSAFSEVEDRVTGLDLGADDYLAKPFHFSELISRIRTLARRMEVTEQELRSNQIIIGDLHIKLDSQEVFRGDKIVSLTAKEFKILTLLAGKPQKVFSKSELLDRVWGIQTDPDSNIVEVAMNRLRAKMNSDGLKPIIHTKRGGGYWLSQQE